MREEGREERKTVRRRSRRKKRKEVSSANDTDDTGRWTTMGVAARGRRRERGHESTKTAGKVSARARGIRVVEKGAKRLPDVPPEEKRWKY